MRISVIIPTLNEAGRIGPLLDGLRESEGVELIVVDGGSEDGTVPIARSKGVKVMRAPAGRASQMNAGAAAARGGILLFLHVDTLLPPDFARHVREALSGEGTSGGAFRFGSDLRSFGMRFVSMMANFRSGRLGVVFGDQAVFARADLFREAGGFPDQPIMEDYEMVRRIRKSGRVVIVPATAVSSSRRWREIGILRNTCVNVFITWAYILGIPATRLHRWHRRLTRRSAA